MKSSRFSDSVFHVYCCGNCWSISSDYLYSCRKSAIFFASCLIYMAIKVLNVLKIRRSVSRSIMSSLMIGVYLLTLRLDRERASYSCCCYCETAKLFRLPSPLIFERKLSASGFLADAFGETLLLFLFSPDRRISLPSFCTSEPRCEDIRLLAVEVCVSPSFLLSPLIFASSP